MPLEKSDYRVRRNLHGEPGDIFNPLEHLVSAFAFVISGTYQEAATRLSSHLRGDPGMHPDVMAATTLPSREEASADLAELCAHVQNAYSKDIAPFRTRVQDILAAAEDLPTIDHAAAVMASIAMALEELMLIGPWTCQDRVRIAVLSARLTNSAVAERCAERYQGFAADVVIPGFTVFGDLLGPLKGHGRIQDIDPRLNIHIHDLLELGRNQRMQSDDLFSCVVALLLESQAHDNLLEEPGIEPYDKRGLLRRREELFGSLDAIDDPYSSEGRAFLLDLSRYLEGLGMNLSTAGHGATSQSYLTASLFVLHLYRQYETRVRREKLQSEDMVVCNTCSPGMTLVWDAQTSAPYHQP